VMLATMRASDSPIRAIVARVLASDGRTDSGRWRTHLDRIEEDADRRQRLPDVVVQLARDALAFAFDRLQELEREILSQRLDALRSVMSRATPKR